MKKRIKLNNIISREEIDTAFKDSKDLQTFCVTFFSSLLSNIVLSVFNKGDNSDDFSN